MWRHTRGGLRIAAPKKLAAWKPCPDAFLLSVEDTGLVLTRKRQHMKGKNS